jgi:hypothetical protein
MENLKLASLKKLLNIVFYFMAKLTPSYNTGNLISIVPNLKNLIENKNKF